MTIEVFVDGSCRKNPGPGGFGVVSVFHNKIQYTYSKQCEDTTNNQQELQAILHALEYCDVVHPKDECLIYSDSAYCVNICNNWIWNWAINGWINSKGKTIENVELIKRLYNYINKDNYHCQIIKVKGHSDNIFNEIADALATDNQKKFNKLKEENNL